MNAAMTPKNLCASMSYYYTDNFIIIIIIFCDSMSLGGGKSAAGNRAVTQAIGKVL